MHSGCCQKMSRRSLRLLKRITQYCVIPNADMFKRLAGMQNAPHLAGRFGINP